MTTRVLLAHHGRLVRGALAAVLAQECDIEVVAESAHGDDLPELVRRAQPHIAILDFDLPTTATMVQLCEELVPLCIILIMADRRSAVCRKIDVARWAPRLGVIAQESPPSVLIEGVRRAMAGELVIDADLARAAVVAGRNPLTERECEVLRLAEAGLTARDIAAKLYLSHGTVRNHLSRVLAKTGGRTRIEAIRFAKDAGWI
jgi:two-component system response regulator DesR